MLRRFLWSVVAAGLGAIAVFLAGLCWVGFDGWKELFTIALIVGFFTVYAWLVFILPLTLLFPDDHKIYCFRFSLPLGIGLSIVALGIYTVAIDLLMRRPSTLLKFFSSPMSAATLLFPMLFGIVTAATLSTFARVNRIKAERTGPANPHAFGTSGISAAEQPRMPEASGDT